MNTDTSTIPLHHSRRGVPGIVLGTLLIGIGGLAAAAAIAMIALFGPAGHLDSGRHQIASSSAAVVTDISKIQNTNSVGTLTGWPTVQVTAGGGNGSGVFIGIGRSDDVDRYLKGVAVDQVIDLNMRPFGITVARQPGSPAAPSPAAQSFWVASASSRSNAELSWPVSDGNYRMVIMNADGTPNLISQARMELVLSNAFPLSLAALGGSLFLVGGGIVIVVLSMARRRHAAIWNG